MRAAGQETDCGFLFSILNNKSSQKLNNHLLFASGNVLSLEANKDYNSPYPL